MKQEFETSREQVSALADGQLHGDEFAQAVDGLAQSQDARQTWHAYHVVGDVLRSGQSIDSARDAAFLARLKLGLQQNAPQAPLESATYLIASYAMNTGSRGQFGINSESANDSRFRWRLLAGVASLAVVSVMGWQTVNYWNDQNGAPQLAQASVQPRSLATLGDQVTTGAPQVMLRDPQLDALLAAHRQFGGTSALQMPAGFLRNATFDGAAR